jgi:hypothetical protein
MPPVVSGAVRRPPRGTLDLQRLTENTVQFALADSSANSGAVTGGSGEGERRIRITWVGEGGGGERVGVGWWRVGAIALSVVGSARGRAGAWVIVNVSLLLFL